MQLSDTDPVMRRRHLDVYRAMSPQRRVELALTMSEEMLGVTVDGIRHRNPAFDDTRVRAELLRILHGNHLAAKISARHPER